MHVLQIEHPVFQYESWKQAFDSDPVNRKQSGVRRYRVLRPIADPHYVIVELEFDTVMEAEALLVALHGLWGRVEGTVMEKAKTRIVEALEVKDV